MSAQIAIPESSVSDVGKAFFYALLQDNLREKKYLRGKITVTGTSIKKTDGLSEYLVENPVLNKVEINLVTDPDGF